MTPGNGWTAAVGTALGRLVDWLIQLGMRVAAWYVFIPAGQEAQA